MWYFKKKDILERLGKDGKDVRYLERAIARWEVIEEWGRWCIVNEDEDGEVSHLRDRIRELEEQLKEKKSEWNEWEQLNANNFEDTAEILRLKGELDEALVNMEYYKENYDNLLEDRRRRLEKWFKRFKAHPDKVKTVQFNDWIRWVLSEDDYI